MRDFPNFPTHFYQMVADELSGSLQLFARGFSRESDEPKKYLHLAPVIQ